MKWHVQYLSDGRFAILSEAKPSVGAREDHPLYAIATCELEFDAHRIARLLNGEEEAKRD